MAGDWRVRGVHWQIIDKMLAMDDDRDRAEMDNRGILHNSIEVLKILYMVVAGLAIAAGLQRFLLSGGGEMRIDGSAVEIIFFAIFVTTVARFVHGAMRHFDRTYSEQPETVNWRIGQPLWDFVGLGFEAVIFFILAYSLTNYSRFINYYLALLLLDSFWLFVISLPHVGRYWTANRKWWTIANLIVLVPAGSGVVFWMVRGGGPYPSSLMWVFIATVGAHTIMDYPLNWRVYFGRPLPWARSKSGRDPEVLFLAGAYMGGGAGDVKKNIKLAEEYSIELWNRGYKVFCPHLNTCNFEVKAKAGEEAYKEFDMRMLRCCDAVFALPNWKGSEGARAEIAEANRLDKPVFYSLDELPAGGPKADAC
jgi:hypothetical protein